MEPDDLDKRLWLFGTWLIRGCLSLLIGSGGQGKSMLAIHIALAVAAGRAWAGQKCHGGPAGVWIYNNEDDLTELHRRVAGVAIHMGIKLHDLDGRLFCNSGYEAWAGGSDTRMLLAVPGPNGEVVATPLVEALIEQIKAKGIKLLILDPFVSMHHINENDNGQMEGVAAIIRHITQAADCAVLLVHHTSKPGDSNQAGNQHAARGASSVAAAARVVLTVTTMNEADAEKVLGQGYPEEVREHCIRIDNGKSNLSAPGMHTTWMLKETVRLPNASSPIADDGDDVGALKPTDFSEFQIEVKQREQDQRDRLRTVMAEVMQDVAVGADLKLKTVMARILAATAEFGKERTLRDRIMDAVPMARAGSVQVSEYRYYLTTNTEAYNPTISVCKRAVDK